MEWMIGVYGFGVLAVAVVLPFILHKLFKRKK